MNNFTKYTILLAATSFCGINAANAVEKGKFYASGSYGVGFADKFDYSESIEGMQAKKPSKANVFAAAIGYGVSDNIRAELSYNGFYGMKYKYHTDDAQETPYKQNLSADALFASAYYDINKFDKIKPYVGFGLGMSQVRASDFTQGDPGHEEVLFSKGSKKNFAYQLGAGITYNLSDKIDLNLVNYRYSDLGKSISIDPEDAEDTASVKLKVHSISTGITFKF